MTIYRAILFDFDGTLTPSLDLWLTAYQAALRVYDLMLEDEFVIRRCFNRNYEDVADDLGLSSGLDLSRQVRQEVERVYAEAVLYPSVAELLNRCQAAGLELGLVTSSFRALVMDVLARLGIDRYFDVVICGEDVSHHKPHPEPVLLALAHLGKHAGETLFVGDNAIDVLAGRAAGTATALFVPDAHKRFYDFDVLHATRPDFLFTHHQELVVHLEPHITARTDVDWQHTTAANPQPVVQCGDALRADRSSS